MGILNIHSVLIGQCGGLTIYQNSIPDPKGFKGSMIVFGDIVKLTLSSDSCIVTSSNLKQPACNVKAVKNGAIQQHLNIDIPLIMNFAKI